MDTRELLVNLLIGVAVIFFSILTEKRKKSSKGGKKSEKPSTDRVGKRRSEKSSAERVERLSKKEKRERLGWLHAVEGKEQQGALGEDRGGGGLSGLRERMSKAFADLGKPSASDGSFLGGAAVSSRGAEEDLDSMSVAARAEYERVRSRDVLEVGEAMTLRVEELASEGKDGDGGDGRGGYDWGGRGDRGGFDLRSGILYHAVLGERGGWRRRVG